VSPHAVDDLTVRLVNAILAECRQLGTFHPMTLDTLRWLALGCGHQQPARTIIRAAGLGFSDAGLRSLLRRRGIPSVKVLLRECRLVLVGALLAEGYTLSAVAMALDFGTTASLSRHIVRHRWPVREWQRRGLSFAGEFQHVQSLLARPGWRDVILQRERRAADRPVLPANPVVMASLEEQT
jgi:hypothetical protein